MDRFIAPVLTWLALPQIGLPAVALVSFVSATLLPLGSEPVLFGYIKLNPHFFWAAISVATMANTAGGMVDWWMGYAARITMVKLKRQRRLNASGDDESVLKSPKLINLKLLSWFERMGPPALLFAWLPGVGDPLCALAGWLRLPWQPCLFFMAIGKFARYLTLTAMLLWIPDGFWEKLLFIIHIT